MNALGQLAERSDGGFPNLTRAREVTERRLSEMRERFKGLDCDDDVCVALFGSWGRRELTEHSDDDWAILIDGAHRGDARPLRSEVEGVLGADGREPGSQGIFGGSNSCDHLVERIGLAEDDNRNLTMRMLLLLESTAVVNEAAHRACRARVLDGFLDDSVKGYRPPRFLLNDLIRYWRTIELDAVDAGVRAVGAYDRFIGLLGDSDARNELARLSRDQARDSEFFVYGKRLAAEFQQGLLALLFETSLEPLVREYGIF